MVWKKDNKVIERKKKKFENLNISSIFEKIKKYIFCDKCDFCDAWKTVKFIEFKKK